MPLGIFTGDAECLRSVARRLDKYSRNMQQSATAITRLERLVDALEREIEVYQDRVQHLEREVDALEGSLNSARKVARKVGE